MSCENNTFYANPNAPSDQVPCNDAPPSQKLLSLVFASPAGTVPPFLPLVVGQPAINETTNEMWFVNSLSQWQQTQGV